MLKLNARSLSAMVAALGIVMASSLPLQAQEFGRVGDYDNSGMSYSYFLRPGEATIQVYLVRGGSALGRSAAGGGGGSGLVEIGTHVDLGRLLLISGSLQYAPRTSRDVVRVLRERDGRRHVVYEATMLEVLERPDEYPQLMDEDIIAIETRPRFHLLRDGVSIASLVTSAALLAIRIVDLVR